MKKIKILSFASLPLAMALLAGCGHTHTFSEEWNHDANKHWHDATCEHKDQVSEEGEHVFGDDNICDVCGYDKGGEPGPGPGPTVDPHKVDEAGWKAAFGADEHLFMFADNYKATMTMSGAMSGEMILEVDGNKLKNNQGGTVFYYSLEDGTAYCYSNLSGSWSRSPIGDAKNLKAIVSTYFEPFGDFSAFAYDEESHTYKAASAIGGMATNLVASFTDGKVMSVSYDSVNPEDTTQVAHLASTFVYGGQSVTLPEVDKPQPGAAVYGYNLNGSGYVAMIHEDKNNQWIALDISVSKDDTITFANMSGSLQEPAVLTTLYCSGETQGFAISEGVLTAGEDGTYSFIISPEETKDRITIEKQESPTPETNCRLMGFNDDWTEGLSMSPTFEGSSEFVAHNLDVQAGMKFKVKFGDDWIGNYKYEGEANALTEHLAVIDGEGNVQFNFGGVYSIYFESNQEGAFGVFVKKESVDCPYVGQAEGIIPGTPTEVHEEKGFFFHKVDVDNNFVEYYLVNCPAFNGIAYTIRNGDNPVDFVLEDAGEGKNFDKSGTTITYKGSATALDFYVKEDLTEHTLKVYVENPDAPVVSNFQILVNGNGVNLTQNESPVDPSFTEWFVTGLHLNENDVIRFRDNTQSPVVDFDILNLDEASVSGFEVGESIKCTSEGDYDIYLKLKMGQDQIYIGAASK